MKWDLQFFLGPFRFHYFFFFFEKFRVPRDLVTLVFEYSGDPADLFDRDAKWDQDVGKIIFEKIIMESCFVDGKLERASMQTIFDMLCDL